MITYRWHYFALNIDGAECFCCHRNEAANLMAYPEIRVIQIAGAVGNEFRQGRFLNEPKFRQCGRCTN